MKEERKVLGVDVGSSNIKSGWVLEGEISEFRNTPINPDEIVNELGARKGDLESVARESDFVVIAAKVTPETQGMFSAELFGLMKPTSYFVNTARAAIVDYEALCDALKAKRIAGAAIDVYEKEPLPENHPFRQLDNILLSPHLAGASLDIPRHHSRMIVDDILRAFNGKKPERLLNPEVWEGSYYASKECQ